MNYILFGPPGIGKSTIIGVLKTLGQRAIDLEDVYPNKIRFSLPAMIDGVVIGAADLNPRRRYNNATTILLTAKQDKYEQRRSERDRKIPHKSQQQAQQVADWEQVDYDHVIDTTALTADQVAQIIIKTILKENSNHEK